MSDVPSSSSLPIVPSRSFSPVTIADIRHMQGLDRLKLSAARIRQLAEKYYLHESEVRTLALAQTIDRRGRIPE